VRRRAVVVGREGGGRCGVRSRRDVCRDFHLLHRSVLYIAKAFSVNQSWFLQYRRSLITRDRDASNVIIFRFLRGIVRRGLWIFWRCTSCNIILN